MFSKFELIFRAFKDKAGEGKFKGFVGLVEDGAGHREVIVKVASHANGLRALTGEEKG
jgi:hypothetical protein